MLTKRGLLGAGLSAAASGCIARPCPPPTLNTASGIETLIDGHAHLFNVKDLSAVRFISIVVAKNYPDLAEPVAFDGPEDPTRLDRLVQAVLRIAGTRTAPSATRERAVLTRAVTLPSIEEDTSPTDPEADRGETQARLSALLQNIGRDQQNLEGEGILRTLANEAGGGPLGVAGEEPPTLTAEQADEIAQNVVSGQHGFVAESRNLSVAAHSLPGLINFACQLKRYRHCLVDELIGVHLMSNQQPLFLAPAMVDFGRWLREDPQERSTFTDQVRTWHVISQREGPASVHGYVGYCPLRQVQHDLGRFGRGAGQIDTPCHDDPMTVVDEALTEFGFLGVKLYPPMGFRATGNAERDFGTYPFNSDVLSDTFGEAVAEGDIERRSRELGEMLDAALAGLFRMCAERGAPIMAHGGNSVSAQRRSGELANPRYWEPVVSDADGPSVMLAHFGGFTDPVDPDAGGARTRPADVCSGNPRPLLEDTWEAWLIRHFAAHSNRPLYADISYWADLLDQGCWDLTRADLSSFSTAERAAMATRLIFGSDWVMLAQESGARDYSLRVRNLLRDLFGAEVEAVMRANFLNYAQLRPGGRTFERLWRSYGGSSRLQERLLRACSD